MQENKIRIKPCTENWEAMTPTEQGRHCSSCEKIVHEVQHLSEKELHDKWHQNNGNLCIRIQQDRTEIIAPRHTKWKYAAVALILSFFTSIKSTFAQIQESNPKPKDQSIDKIIDSCKISGSVVDSLESNAPIPFAFIQIRLPDSSLHNTYSDLQGKFSITIKTELNTSDSIQIECTMLGYEKAIATAKIQDTIETNIILGQNHFCLNEAVIAVPRVRGMVKGNMTMGIWIHDGERKVYRKEEWDQYDTKTFHHDEIERYNLGR